MSLLHYFRSVICYRLHIVIEIAKYVMELDQVNIGCQYSLIRLQLLLCGA